MKKPITFSDAVCINQFRILFIESYKVVKNQVTDKIQRALSDGVLSIWLAVILVQFIIRDENITIPVVQSAVQ